MEENYLNQPTYHAGLMQSQAFRALSNFMVDYLMRFDLTLSEWKLLGQLTEAGKMKPSEISNLLAIKAPITSRLLGSLEEKKWVERRAIKKDSRTKVVLITPQGKKTVTKIENSLRPKLKHFLGDIPPEDLTVYLRVLDRLAQKI